MKTFFTADYHLGHANIIEYCNRPFKNVSIMNDTIIKNHNQRVKDDDIVYFLGDFCFKNSEGGKKGEGLTIQAKKYIKKLNGHFVFIKGNHDRNNSLKVNLVRGVLHMGNVMINMIHDPKHANPKYPLNLCGHVHNAFRLKEIDNQSLLINVGIDLNNFYPYTFDEIMKIYHLWRKGKSGK